MIQQNKETTLVAPTENKLRLLLANGQEFIEIVEKSIKDFNLPYTVKLNESTGLGELVPTLSNGEIYLEKFITVDKETLQLKENARKIARCKYEVLITGETGTGKELIAKSMIADRAGKVMCLNCAGFPENLIESELFGHEKGSFTGADIRKRGLMMEAKDGVLFLDEIGEMQLHLQAKLLRALQEKRIRRVGSVIEEEINCKFVCATNRDLKEMVKEGKFRQDLYARISTLELHIKPLRERMDDIIPITESLENGKKFIEQYGVPLLQGSLDLSLNVRSLQQHVTRFNVLGKIIP